MNCIVVLLRNHIHVCLKNHTFPVFHTRSAGLRIITLPASSTKDSSPSLFRNLNQKFSHLSPCVRTDGNLSQRIKCFHTFCGAKRKNSTNNKSIFLIKQWLLSLSIGKRQKFTPMSNHIHTNKTTKRFEYRAQLEQIFRHPSHLLRKASSSPW